MLLGLGDRSIEGEGSEADGPGGVYDVSGVVTEWLLEEGVSHEVIGEAALQSWLLAKTGGRWSLEHGVKRYLTCHCRRLALEQSVVRLAIIVAAKLSRTLTTETFHTSQALLPTLPVKHRRLSSLVDNLDFNRSGVGRP